MNAISFSIRARIAKSNGLVIHARNSSRKAPKDIWNRGKASRHGPRLLLANAGNGERPAMISSNAHADADTDDTPSQSREQRRPGSASSSKQQPDNGMFSIYSTEVILSQESGQKFVREVQRVPELTDLRNLIKPIRMPGGSSSSSPSSEYPPRESPSRRPSQVLFDITSKCEIEKQYADANCSKS